MWQRLFGSKPHACRVYPRPEATLVVPRGPAGNCDPVARLGPRPYAAELGDAILKAMRGGKGASALPFAEDEVFFVVDIDGKSLTLQGQPVENEPRLLGEAVLRLAAVPAPGTVAPQPPQAFGQRTAWLAATCPPQVLIEAMGLRQVQPCTWEDGLAGHRGVFVTPQVGDYTFAVGLPYPDPESDAVSDPLLLFVESLSQRARRVAYFAADPLVGLAAWALAEEGTIVRAYAYLGEMAVTLWRLGMRTDAEATLPAFFDSGDDDADDPAYWQRSDLTYPEPEHVLEMARAWTSLELGSEPSSGWSGKLSVA